LFKCLAVVTKILW
jgi:hypothetical protein